MFYVYFLFFLFKGKDRLFNKICGEMINGSAEFPIAMSNDVVSKHMSTIVNVLWYLDGNKHKLVERSTHNRDVQPIPDRYMHKIYF